ncbi:MAG TPA: alkaline phosphatase PhoX [Thermodesulfobacteriota bacterium]|nr:alkaline phosphatase PhoX [Thermodesulfobacteriota bacterium]
MKTNDKQLSRRSFLRNSAVVAGGVVLGASTLQMITAHSTWAKKQGKGGRGNSPQAIGYGPLTPVRDQDGDEILALPHGFHYVTFGKIGEIMSDGNLTPRNHDGMAAFPGPHGTVRLIRNHEVRNAPNDPNGAVGGPGDTRYDPLGVGGTVTIDYDPRRRRVVRDFVSLNGTIVNCAGGYSFGDIGWITCEETTQGPNNGWMKKHGYCFLVPASAEETVLAVPIIPMGRFSHEACVADPSTGIVYLTEDAGSGIGSGFYRYLPNDPFDLLAGGVLQILMVKNLPQYDTREGQTEGQVLPVEWVTIPDPNPDLENGEASVFDQGFGQGGAKFNRLEGIFRGEGDSVFFAATSGGDAKNGDVNSDGFEEGYGQIWQYRPTPGGGELMLVFESTAQSVLDSPDNLCVTPRGGLIMCEDDAGSNDGDTHPLAPGITDVNRLVGLTPEGVPFEFAVNRLNDSEFAGACFSPDGKVLFVNIFGDGTPGSGMTCAITGPWGRGPL